MERSGRENQSGYFQDAQWIDHPPRWISIRQHDRENRRRTQERKVGRRPQRGRGGKTMQVDSRRRGFRAIATASLQIITASSKSFANLLKVERLTRESQLDQHPHGLLSPRARVCMTRSCLSGKAAFDSHYASRLRRRDILFELTFGDPGLRKPLVFGQQRTK